MNRAEPARIAKFLPATARGALSRAARAWVAPAQVPAIDTRDWCHAALVLFAFWTLSLPSLAFAEPKTVVAAEEIDVRLTEIEVVVTDRDGAAVSGLVADDFEVLLDGDPVNLTHFRASVGSLALSGDVSGVTAEDRPLGEDAAEQLAEPSDRLNLVIYVDRSFLELGDLTGVREALKGFLHSSLRPGDRTMLVTAAESIEVVQGFTTVPELVSAKLDGVRERPGGNRFGTEFRSILQEMQRIKNEGSDIAPRDPRHMARAFISQIQAFAAEIEGEMDRTTGHLERLVQTIAGLDGRRAVIYVGGRIPTAHPRRLYDVWDSAFGRFSNVQIADNQGGLGVGGGDGGGEGGGGGASPSGPSDALFDSISAASSIFAIDAGRLVEDVAKLANTHGVIFHTLDAASLRGSADLFSAAGDTILPSRGSVTPSVAVASGSLPDALSSLRNLAWETGGRDFAGSRDFRMALARIDEDLKTYYSLGFEPPEGMRKPARVKVKLRGDRTKLKVRHRPLIQLKDRDTLEAERTISALLLETAENPLRVTLEPGNAEPHEEGGWRVPVTVSIPLAKLALVADGQAHTGRLSIYAASGGLQQVGAVIKAVVPVRIPNQDLLTSLGRRVAYQLQLKMPAGPDRVAVTVRDDFRPQSSTAMTSVGTTGAGPSGSELSSE